MLMGFSVDSGEFNIWVMSINTKNGDSGYNGRDALRFCREKKIIGMGWIIDEKVKTLEEAEKLLKKRYKTTSSQPIKFIKEMKVGDLVWIYDVNERNYYLCRVESGWENEISGTWKKSDIVWHRAADWKKIGREHIPGIILRNPRIRTIVKAKIPSDSTRKYVWDLYKHGPKKLQKKDIENLELKVNELGDKEILELLDPDEIEDIVCTYIQSKGWRLIKSTASKSLPDFECEFKLDGQMGGVNRVAYVQVKTGNQRIVDADLRVYKQKAETGAKIFLYSESALVHKPKGIERISQTKLLDYLKNNLSELRETTINKLAHYIEIY